MFGNLIGIGFFFFFMHKGGVLRKSGSRREKLPFIFLGGHEFQAHLDSATFARLMLLWEVSFASGVIYVLLGKTEGDGRISQVSFLRLLQVYG
jgi:formate/nitrite transporter FocA (FNT family)